MVTGISGFNSSVKLECFGNSVSKLAASFAGSVEVRVLDLKHVPTSLWMENLFLIHNPAAEPSPWRKLHTLRQTHRATRHNTECKKTKKSCFQ